MAVIFPNPCRSFDANKNRVQFWGYDSTIEISFFIEGEALKMLCPDTTSTEAGYLKAFDTGLTRIHKTAGNMHVRSNKGSYSYILTVGDFLR